MGFKWCVVVVYLHIASELEDVVGPVFSLGLCYYYLNTIVGSHKASFFSMTSWVEVGRPNKDHMNHCIAVVASNYSQCLELCARIDCTYHSTPHQIKKAFH